MPDIAIFVNLPNDTKAMKCKIFYLLIFFTALAQAQVINIPDANFKAALISANAGNGIALDNGGDDIVIDTNGNGTIEQDEAEEVRELYITSLNIANLEGIQYFTNLRVLNCSVNNLTILDAAVLLPEIRELSCAHNSLTSLYVAGLEQLRVLQCQNNSITDIDFTGLEYLTSVNCSYNLLTQLDFSGCPELTDFSCSDNDITVINIKNGQVQGPVYSNNLWANNPLQYVCTDEDEITIVNSMLSLGGYTAVSVNTYCSFVPGGDYNTITGSLIFDAQNDGCGPGDAPYCFVKLRVIEGADTSYVFTNEQGNYNFYTQAGNFTVTPDFENDGFYNAAPSSGNIEFTTVDNLVSSQDFCVSANGMQSDVEVVMVPVSKAVPGQPARYKVVYKNKGNTTIANGTISCMWNFASFSGISDMYPFPSNVEMDLYEWDFANLRPFEHRQIEMTLTLNTPSDNEPINVGDNIPFTAQVSSAYTDAQPVDNAFVLKQKAEAVLQDSYIQCLEGESLPFSAVDDYLHYVVSFTNSGSAVADNVVISQNFDPDKFDISTLEILNSSHNAVARIAGNNATIIMEGAGIADGNGHGDILFKLKPKPGLQTSVPLTVRSSINFDYRLAEATNTATVVFETLSTGDFEKDLSVNVYPNPVINSASITADGIIRTVELYDIQGRLLQTNIVNDNNASLDMSSRAVGLYFVKVITEKGIKVEKLIKQ